MTTSTYHERLFLAAGLWNLGGAVPAFVASIWMTESAFSLVGMAVPEVLFPYHAMYAFIATFGIGYLIVSRDISANRGIVWLGVIGKVLFFTLCAVAFARREANVLLLVTGAGDLVFAVSFLKFLQAVR